jgi:hypothetical protein
MNFYLAMRNKFFLLFRSEIVDKKKRENFIQRILTRLHHILDSIVVSIPACHAGDRGSIPRRGGYFLHGLPSFIRFFCLDYL